MTDWVSLLHVDAFQAPRVLAIYNTTRKHMQSLSAQFSWDAGRVLSTRSGAPWPRSLDTKQPPPPPRMCPTRPGADLSIMWGRGLAANLTCCASGSAAPRTYVMQGGMERMFNKCVTQCRRLRNLNMAGVQGVLVLAGIRGQPLKMEFPLYPPPPPLRPTAEAEAIHHKYAGESRRDRSAAKPNRGRNPPPPHTHTHTR